MFDRLLNNQPQKRKFHEFILMESDERVTLDLNHVISFREKTYYDVNKKSIFGIELIFINGIVFWIKGNYNEIKTKI